MSSAMTGLRTFGVNILLVLTMGCDALMGPTIPYRQVELSEEQKARYYSALAVRWRRCFAFDPELAAQLPSWEELSDITFWEFPAEYRESCYYANGKAQIGDDKWESGCVPHEIGHHACHKLGNPAWCRNYEHVWDGERYACR